MAEKIKITLFYVILFLFILAFSTTSASYDNDLWARLIVGKEVFQSGHVFLHDIFSYIPTHLIMDHEWGSGVVFYFVQKVFGVQGFVFLQAFLLFLTFVFIIKIINLRGVKTTSAYNFLFYYFVFIALSQVVNNPIRCQLFSFLFFTIFLYLLEKIRLKDSSSLKIIYLFPLLMIFWCNLHGGCVIGLGLILLYIIGEILNKKPVKKYIYSFLLCCPALIINPWGLHYIQFLLNTNSDSRALIVEWASPFSSDFVHSFFKIKIFAMLLILVELFNLLKKVFYAKSTIDKTKLLVILATTFEAALHIKLTPFCVIVLACFAYDDFYVALSVITKNIFSRFEHIKNFLLYSVIILFSVYNIYVNGFGPYLNYTEYPILATEFIKINKLSGNLLADFNYGSYLSYKLYPQNKIYIDGRYDTVYYQWELNLIRTFFDENQGYDLILNKYKTDYILLNNENHIFQMFLKNKKYAVVFNDSKFSIFTDKKNAKKSYLLPSLDKTHYTETLFDTDINFRDKKWQKM